MLLVQFFNHMKQILNLLVGEFFFLKIIIDVFVNFVSNIIINEIFNLIKASVVQMFKLFLIIFFVNGCLLLDFLFPVPKYCTVEITAF